MMLLAPYVPWLSRLLRPLIKRRWNYDGPHALPAYFYFQRRTQGRELRRHVRQGDVLLQKGRRRPAGDIADLFSDAVEHLISVARNAAFDHFQTDQRPLHTLDLSILQRGAADELRLLRLAETVEARFPDIYRI